MKYNSEKKLANMTLKSTQFVDFFYSQKLNKTAYKLKEFFQFSIQYSKIINFY